MRRTRATKERLHSEERRLRKNSGSEQENDENPQPPREFRGQNRERKEPLRASTTAPWLGRESRKHQQPHYNVLMGSEQVTRGPTPNPRTQAAIVATLVTILPWGQLPGDTRPLEPMCTSQAEKRPLRDSS